MSIDTALFSADFQSELLTALSEDTENLDDLTNGVLIHADNFQALNLLQARYREQVKCIYIDPPYNTGSDNSFLYKDSFQHSSWASMMESRFNLARSLVINNAGIWVSTDDGEYSHLKFVMDVSFGSQNFVADVIWNSRKSVSSDTLISGAINHTTFFAKNKQSLEANKNQFRLPESSEGFSNPDNDPRGLWKLDPLDAPNIRENLSYPIKNPQTGQIFYPPEGRCWRFEEKTVQKYLEDNRILFGKTGKGKPAFKRFYEDAKDKGRTTTTLWNDVGTTTNGTKLLYDIFGDSIGKEELNKIKPKPIELVQRIAQLHQSNTPLILDYFAGSGTTAHAVINLNREDDGKRQYILVEQGEYFDTVLKPRVQKVIYSDSWKNGEPQADKDGHFNGVSQMVKVLKLESYEDTLNNLALPKDSLLDNLPQSAQSDYRLRYLLDVESRDSLLSASHFNQPFTYQLDIATDSAGASETTTIDLVETFNYLLGLSVHRVEDCRYDQGYVMIEGVLPQHRDKAKPPKTLIIWRDCTTWGEEKLGELLDKKGINPNSTSFKNAYHGVYLNGDNTVITAWQDSNDRTKSLNLQAIEGEFLRLMFEGES